MMFKYKILNHLCFGPNFVFFGIAGILAIFCLQPAMVADTFTQAWPAIFYRTSPVAVSEPLITVLSLIKKLII